MSSGEHASKYSFYLIYIVPPINEARSINHYKYCMVSVFFSRSLAVSSLKCNSLYKIHLCQEHPFENKCLPPGTNIAALPGFLCNSSLGSCSPAARRSCCRMSTRVHSLAPPWCGGSHRPPSVLSPLAEVATTDGSVWVSVAKSGPHTRACCRTEGADDAICSSSIG